MTELLAVFVCDKYKFMSIFNWLLFPKANPAPQGKVLTLRVKKNSEDSCIQFGTLFEIIAIIETLEHLNKMEQLFARVLR